MYDAIIFDLDGTLWDASDATAKGWSSGLFQIGIKNKITAKRIREVTGRPQEECIKMVLPGLENRYPNLLDILNVYEKKITELQGGKFYQGVLVGLKQLSKKYKIFLVSNCQYWYLDLFFKFFKSKSLFRGYDCHGMSDAPKDQMLLNLKKKHSLKNAVYIGDTSGDEEAAGLAGMEFIHVTYGFGSPKKNPKSFDSFKELAEYLM